MQVWQRSNWHWYLRQELRPFAGFGLNVAWNEMGLGLDMVASNGSFGSVSDQGKNSASDGYSTYGA